MQFVVTERGDSERRLGWQLRMAVSTIVRNFLSLRSWGPQRIMTGAAVVGALGVLFVISIPLMLVVMVVAVVVVLRPVMVRLRHGRVWEVREVRAGHRARCIGWAVAVPHPSDQQTWRLDITSHPLRRERVGWAYELIERVNESADIFDVSVQSLDPHDEPVLAWHGYLPAQTLLSGAPVLQRFPPARERDTAGSELRTSRESVTEDRNNPIKLRRLSDDVLTRSKEVLSTGNPGWNQVVLRRTGALWELARASAIALDGYIDALSLGSFDPSSFPEGSAGLDVRLDRLSQVLMACCVHLRTSVQVATQEFRVRNGEPLLWAQSLALLEIEALALTGLVASARRGKSVTLAVIDPEVQRHVAAAARSVLRHARSLRGQTLFDTVGLVWWSLAIAGDALDLCGNRSGRVVLRRAVGRLKANDLRRLVVIPLTNRPNTNQTVSDDPLERWARLGSVARLGQEPGKTLADLSATRAQRVGTTRGAEGLRHKRLRRATGALILNNVVLLVAGAVVWLFIVLLRNPPDALLVPIVPLAHALQLDLPQPIERIGSDRGYSVDLPVNTDLVWETTLGLLAVVITGAVAVAVAVPRESSTRLWAQDRAWQLLIVTVGYGASTAALVLAIAPLSSWPTLSLNDRAEASAALAFALLAACAATSTSALQSRLDIWQRQRRLLTASLRLRRANDRLGPPPGIPTLAARGLACFLLCLTPLASFVVLISLTSPTSAQEFWELLWQVGLLNLPPMVLLTTLLVVKWANDWGLAGRIATATLFALAIALILYAMLFVMTILTLEDLAIGILVLVVILSPILLLWIALIAARRLANHVRRWTGPAAFALHASVRLARWNYRRSNA